MLDRAHIARATFYAHYRDKAGCFLATVDAVLKAVEAEVSDIDSALGLIARHPHEAWCLLVESHACPPALERRRRALSLVAERCGGTAVAAGVAALAITLVPDGRESELPALVDDLRSWAQACRKVQIAPRPSGAVRSRRRGQAPGTLLTDAGTRALPPGPKRERPPLIAANQRDRLLDAVAVLVARDGLQALNVATVVAEAETSKRTFYEHFESADEAFVAALEFGVSGALGAARGAYGAAGSWPEGIRAAVRSLCGFLAEEPAFARIFLVDSLGESRAALGMRESCRVQLSRLLQEAYVHDAAGTAGPSLVFAAEVGAGALIELCAGEVRDARASELPALAEAYGDLLLAPRMGGSRRSRS